MRQKTALPLSSALPLWASLPWLLASVGCGDTAKFNNPSAGPKVSREVPLSGNPNREAGTRGIEREGPDAGRRGASSSADSETESETESSSEPSSGVSGSPGAKPAPDSPPAPGVPPTTAEEVTDACARGQMQTMEHTLAFPRTDRLPGKPSKGKGGPRAGLGLCTWESSPRLPNGERSSDIIRGVHSQQVSVSLPEGAVVCSASLSSEESTRWRYDDEVVFLLNGVVITTTQDRYLWRDPLRRLSPIHPPLGSGFVFNWQRLVAEEQFNEASTSQSLYCYGNAPGAAGCELPPTEQVGRVQLSLGTSEIALLSLSAVQKKSLTYELLVTGDNDPEIDCRHDGLTLKARVDYVLP